MGELRKATLQEISADDKRTPLGPPVEVQFNPTTLQLQISNQVEGGRTRGRQTRQYIGSSSTVLTLELVFDSADEGTTDVPRSVREKTAIVERYVLPKQDGKEAPPKLRFQWGSLIIDGVVDSVSIDFDHFAADGTPLRAKVGLSIREQNAKYQFLQSGPGANRGGGVPLPGALGLGAVGGLGVTAGVGLSAGVSLEAGVGVGFGASAGVALGGETAAEFAARVGLDPAAWRSLDADLTADLAFAAGAEVGFSVDVPGGAGPGAAAGFEAGAGASLEASFGLEAGGPALGGERGAGFALAAAGGVAAAVETVEQARADGAAAATREAFGAPAAAAPPNLVTRPGRPDQPRTPLRTSGVPGPSRRSAAAPAPPPPAADPRAVSYGFGVPLRPRQAVAAAERAGELGGTAPLRPGLAPSPIEPAAVPTTPPWERLPRGDRGRAAGERAQAGRRRASVCGCSHPCHHRGGRS